jgi:hypothetical protein
MHELSVKSLNNDFSPDPPKTVEETQLDFGFLADLTLKVVYADANCSTARAAERLCLSGPMTETLLQHLYREKLVEIRGIESFQNHRYAMLDRGWQRADRLLDLNGYIGPAPVSLQAYTDMVTQQSQDREPFSPESLQEALSELFLPEVTLQTLGLVISSRRSLFMYGESVKRGRSF